MKKIENKKGFTLIETLACIITLLLLCGICNMGTNMALNSYNKSMFLSDSQMLESTINLHLGDILRHASITADEVVDANGLSEVINFTNTYYGIRNGSIEVITESGKPNYGYFVVHKNEADDTGVMFINENIYTNTLYISNFVLKYNKTQGYVTGSYVINSTILEDASKECTFTYSIATDY